MLAILQKHDLSLNIEKCTFHVLCIPYLGMIISKDQVKMDPEKIETVASWKEPLNKKELQSFLGFCNYYHRFIQNYSHIA